MFGGDRSGCAERREEMGDRDVRIVVIGSSNNSVLGRRQS